MTGPARVASFTLVREPGWRSPQVMARLATDRRRLGRVPGLRFWRLLGTGRGQRTSFSVDPSRSALFAVWEDAAALEGFLASSALARRWQAARECWTVRLALLGGHGRWQGVDVLDGVRSAEPGGPVAVLTRANVRVRAWHRFRAAGFGVSDAAVAAPGLRAVVGIGEAPVGKQATFSVWSDAAALRGFAYRDPAHVDVVRRTRAEGWYGEDLFARFAPLGATGTWDGRDPTA